MRINFFCLSFILLLNAVKGSKIPQKRDILASLFISSGTLWCGKGNIAENCDQLGEFSQTDNCCREHDSCPYTFASDMVEEFNGFTSQYLATISHCECDVIFSECLHEKPYKEKSYEVWESFLSLNVKCFSYLPCDESDEHDNIWQNVGRRDSGKCVNGSRIMVFDSIMDYSDLMVKLRLSQKLLINKRLITDKKNYISPSKKIYKCAHSFPNFSEKISNNFESEFLKGDSNYEFLSKKINLNNKVEVFDRIINIVNSKNYVTQSKRPVTTEVINLQNYQNSTKTNINKINEHDVNTHNEPKTIFLYNIIVPMVVILAIFVFLKFLINLYDKDNL